MEVSVITSQPRQYFPGDVVSVETVLPWRWGEHVPNIPIVLYNLRVLQRGWRLFRKSRPAFLYQRHLLFNISGLLLSRVLGVPLILEYNGSEVWMVERWGRGWTYFMHLARWMENLNIRLADMLVVVSDHVCKEVLDKGVPPERVLVNFNGVNPRVFHPQVGGSAVRDRYGISRDTLVAGFIGTFSFWHGVEVLAKAVRQAVAAVPNLHFLFIGDGPLLDSVKEQIVSDGCEAHVTFTGRVPSEEAPAHLAACDILLSPHVQNPDGSPFFGSPTKLFEYMAMGRAIAASGIEQLAQVLEHERTALLVPPDDPEALARSVVRLASNKQLRLRLGRSARDHVVKHYTWDGHVARILDRVRNIGLVA
jgi:glycosyltransferase involved in cell wall biosynthesis